jgi:hypothetical protein
VCSNLKLPGNVIFEILKFYIISSSTEKDLLVIWKCVPGFCFQVVLCNNISVSW